MKYQSFNHVARAFTLLSSSSSPSHLSVACLASKPSGSKSSASVEVWQTKLSDRSKKKRKNARQISLLPQSAILNTFTHALFINTVAQYFPEFRCRSEVAIVPYAILLWIALVCSCVCQNVECYKWPLPAGETAVHFGKNLFIFMHFFWLLDLISHSAILLSDM